MHAMSPAGDNEERPAPGPLRLLQDFLNTPTVAPTPDDLRIARAIRDEGDRGASQSTLAARYGVSRALVSAILRGKRLPPRAPGAPPPPHLGTPAARRAWLAAHGFLRPRDQLSPRDDARILKLHAILLDLALANAGHPPPPGTREALDAFAAGSPFRIAFSEHGTPALAPARGGADAFVGALLATVYDATRDGTFARLKACPADRCQYVFYDASRNATATWCSMSICGNRAKVRAYQQRRRASRPS